MSTAAKHDGKTPAGSFIAAALGLHAAPFRILLGLPSSLPYCKAMNREEAYKPLRLRSLWLVLGWSMVTLVIVFSLLPVPPESPVVKVPDKLLHVAGYFGLMVWFCSIYQSNRHRRRIAVLLVLMGVILEFAQGITGHRSMDWLDVKANGLGVLLGLFVSRTRLSNSLMFVEALLSGDK